jgi:hypothetical protein
MTRKIFVNIVVQMIRAMRAAISDEMRAVAKSIGRS